MIDNLLPAHQKMHTFFPPKPLVAAEQQWVCTRSGRKFFPLNPQPEQIEIADIAFGMAGKYRFGGQSPKRYTVAQHSIEVCRQLASNGHGRDVCLWGLLHDAAEAWLVDWQRPVKWQQFWWDSENGLLVSFAEIEKRILYAVQKSFGLSPDYFHPDSELAKAVDAADCQQLLRERCDLFDDRQPPWDGFPASTDLYPLPPILNCFNAYDCFMAMFIRVLKTRDLPQTV